MEISVKLLCFICLLITSTQSSKLLRATMKVQDWHGKFQGTFSVLVPENINGWEAFITFKEPITDFMVENGDILNKSTDNMHFVILNKPYKGIIAKGQTLTIKVTAAYSGSKPPDGIALIKNLIDDGQTVPLHNKTKGAKYDYDDVLMKSILFYEAQRSGKLPESNRIPWRGDSALSDKGENGEDLTGGWYDAGDHVKFGHPMAGSVTMLAWGLLIWKDAYESSGQLDYMYDCIKWPLDYFIKAHVGGCNLYVQVGDGGKDHAYWGRPEDMKMARPSFKITSTKPGSDVSAETAAAMAASYMAFKNKDPAYAATLLKHAEELYECADKHRGLYSNSVPAAASYYRSYATEDELSWGGAWLYLATKKQKYLDAAEKSYETGGAWGQSWDEKWAGAQVLLYNITKKDVYKTDIETTYTEWMPGGKLPYTPKGMAYRLQWGPLRYTANMAMVALMAAETGLHPATYRKWAMGQIHYALGDSGHSYVVGFGVNPPKRPHHRSSSCSTRPAPCGWDNEKAPGPNPHVLYGALVGGPGKSDDYKDDRSDYVHNEVACDYNAGFQSAVAGLKHLALIKQLPTAA